MNGSNKLKIKLPWWYKFFIKYMPNFYKELPEYKEGKYKWEAGTYGYFGSYRKISSKKYVPNNQKAYIKARFAALKIDWMDSSQRGVYWEIKLDKDN